MGGRGPSSATAAAAAATATVPALSPHDAALKKYLLSAANQNDNPGASKQNQERASEYRAAAGLIGTDRIVTLTNSDSYKSLRSMIFAGAKLKTGNINSYLKGKNKPRGMSDAKFQTLQQGLSDLKSQGFTNEEIMGALRNFGSSVWK